MDVTVAIICWNGKILLEKNLPFVLKALENKNNKISEVIIVDDFSTDGSVNFVNEKYPQIKVIRHDKNYGYAKSCNTALRHAGSQLVALLNLDVIPQEDFLVSGFKHFENDRVFSVSFNEGKFGQGKLITKKGFIEIEPTKIPDSFVETDWPSGGSSIFNKEIWTLLGGMDEIYLPFYFEDVDLGIRARKSGYISYWEPNCKVIHEHEGTINSASFKNSYIDLIKKRNYLILNWKNLSKDQLLNHLKFLFIRIIKSPKFSIALLMAVLRILKIKLFHILK